MPTQITSAGITFNDTTSLTSATLVANSVGTTQITNGAVTAAKLGTNEQKQIAKAWVNFNGTTGAIRASYGISSVTRNSVGIYTIAFSTPMADANYAIAGFCNFENTVPAGIVTYGSDYSQSTGSFVIKSINCTNGAVSNSSYVEILIFGN